MLCSFWHTCFSYRHVPLSCWSARHGSDTRNLWSCSPAEGHSGHEESHQGLAEGGSPIWSLHPEVRKTRRKRRGTRPEVDREKEGGQPRQKAHMAEVTDLNRLQKMDMKIYLVTMNLKMAKRTMRPLLRNSSDTLDSDACKAEVLKKMLLPKAWDEFTWGLLHVQSRWPDLMKTFTFEILLNELYLILSAGEVDLKLQSVNLFGDSSQWTLPEIAHTHTNPYPASSEVCLTLHWLMFTWECCF